jgi:2-oxoisovalerate dehydrogenase E2 component (dihydrolipoyl transacylase)
MSIDFILPDIGEGIVECELVEWLVKEGETVVEDQPIADVMTDKALVQIPAMHAGVIEKLFYKQGDIAKVHLPLFSMITAEDGASCEPQEVHRDVDIEEKPQQSLQPESSNGVEHELYEKNTQNEEQSDTNPKALASPAVRRVARELGVNISEVSGSGNKGRVYKEDILSFEQGSNTMVNQAQTSSARVEPIRGVRSIMAKAMVNSVNTIPHFTHCEEIDMTELIKLRLAFIDDVSIRDSLEKQDIKLTMLPFLMKAMSLALTEFPVMNSQVNEECSEVTYFYDHNIGIAVDSKVGLLVPNVKQVQNKSIIDLATDITHLTIDARSGKVHPDDLKGGTITISNIGAIGGTVATPIINKPEAAIVALGKCQTLPRFNEQGSVEARSIMQVSWSGDHRIIDGGTIARFCNLWKSFIEKPSSMLVHLS